jgi:hypothetical protein
MNIYFAISGSFLIARGIGMFMNYDYEFSLYFQRQYGTLEYVIIFVFNIYV